MVNLTNGVNEATILHWHGMLLPPEMDGGPHQMILPGETWSPTCKVDQPASTSWFHPHLHGVTAEQVYRGATGMFILDDVESQEMFTVGMTFPLSYRIKTSAVMDHFQIAQNGLVMWVVNGTHSPFFEAHTNLVRFRILNASTSRVYNIRFNDKRPYHLIGTDSGLLESPVKMDSLLLSPGERAEIVVQISPNDNVVLQSISPDLESPFWAQRFNGGDDSFDILNIRGNSLLEEWPALPNQLVKIDWPDEAEVIEKRFFELTGQSRINGKLMDMNRIDDIVTAGTTEIWEVSNPREETYHNFHVHGIHFSILDVNGQEPPDYLKGWKDTVYLLPVSKVTLIARFESYTNQE